MKNSDNDLSVMLAQDCMEAFERLDAGLRRILDPRRPVPLCRYRLRNKEDFNARIRKPGHAAHLAIVEMNRGTLSTLHQSIVRSSNAILSAIRPAGETTIDDELLTSVYDVAIHFILLHELYHIYEGHLDFLSHRKGHNALAETGRYFTGDDPQLDRDTAYYLEMEADGSALVSLLTHIAFQSIVKQATAIEAVHPDHTFVQELTGQARLFAFRIILCAAWIVGALMEVNRPNDDDHRVLPIARMLSMISTLLSWFIEANELEANEQGELIQRLNEKQPLLIALFLNDVAKPVIVSLWQFPGSTADASKALFRSSNALEQFLRDMQSLLGRQPTTSPFAQQIVISESLRGTLDDELAPYRYITER